jgi:hypothetical protein
MPGASAIARAPETGQEPVVERQHDGAQLGDGVEPLEMEPARSGLEP